MTTKREWVQYPQDIPVETKFGTIFLAITNGERIYANASSNGRCLTYRSTQYSTSLYLECAIGGEWVPTRDEKDPLRESRSAFYCKKLGFYAYGKDEAPKTHAAAIKAEVLRAVREWAAANPAVILEGERAAASNALRAAEEDYEKAREAVAEAHRVLGNAHHRFAAARHNVEGQEVRS